MQWKADGKKAVLKTWKQDFKIAIFQESKKTNGMEWLKENSLSIGKENSLQRKQAVFVEWMKTKKQERKQAVFAERKQSFQLSSFQHGTKENYPAYCMDG